MTKRLLHESIEHSINDHLQLERHGIADSMGTQDLRRGVTAFFGGRAARSSRATERNPVGIPAEPVIEWSDLASSERWPG